MTAYERLIESATPAAITDLKTEDLPVLIDAAVEFDRRRETFEELLDACKARLKLEAERDAKAEKLDPEGTSWDYKSGQGFVARVSFPKPGLIRSFFINKEGQACTFRGDEMVKLGDLEKICDGPANFAKLFAKYFKPAKAFRELCKALLKPAAAAKLIDAVTDTSPARVTFETKQG